jgi:small subunit ribosomal protein S18
MGIPNGDKPNRYPQKKFFHKKKFCRFRTDSNVKIDYKNPMVLNNFITERGKIMPRRITGNCASHQRELALAIKRSRMIAIMPFVTGEGR